MSPSAHNTQQVGALLFPHGVGRGAEWFCQRRPEAVRTRARAISLGKPTLASENDRNSSHRKSIDNTTSTTYDKPPSCVSIIFWVVLGDYDADCEIALVSGEKSKYVLPSAITKSILESAVALPALYHRVLA